MPDTPGDILPLAGHEEHRRKLREDRRIEYNDIVKEADEYKASILAADEGEATKKYTGRQSQQTTKSSIEFADCIGDRHSYLVQQQRKKWKDVDIKPYKLESSKLRDVNSQSESGGGILVEKRPSETSHKCLDSSPAVPRRRWIIPDYEAILNQKRSQESNYRRANDAAYGTDLRAHEVSDFLSNIDKQVIQDEHKGDLQKQNREMVLAKRVLASDTALGHGQVATDCRNYCGSLDTVGGNAFDLFCGLFREPMRQVSLDPPPDLYYQPATFVTDKSAPNPYSFIDEAYNFYASHNPLDPNLNTEASYVLGHAQHRDSFMQARLNDANPQLRSGLRIPGSGWTQVAVPPKGEEDVWGKWHFSSGNEEKSPNDYLVASLKLSDLICDSSPCLGAHIWHDRKYSAPGASIECASNADQKQNLLHPQASYQDELGKQLLEKSQKTVGTTDALSKCNLKLQGEVNECHAGRGSDAHCKAHHDLADTASVAERDHFTQTLGGDKTYSRGGYGIFGVPMTDAQKIQAEKYMADLKKQIEEKQAAENKKRELQRLEEEREQKILNEQRIQMQKEYEEEQRRIKEKAEE
ncbi:unnamed protein product, partial [Candidula unifasciata]